MKEINGGLSDYEKDRIKFRTMMHAEMSADGLKINLGSQIRQFLYSHGVWHLRRVFWFHKSMEDGALIWPGTEVYVSEPVYFASDDKSNPTIEARYLTTAEMTFLKLKGM